MESVRRRGRYPQYCWYMGYDGGPVKTSQPPLLSPLAYDPRRNPAR